MRTRLLPLMIGLLLLSAAISPLNAAAVSDPTGTDAPLPECFQQTDERWAGKELIGPNGCGKSTLAKHFNAILLPSGGKVYVCGIDTANEDRLIAIRRNVGMVFQNPDNQIVANVV